MWLLRRRERPVSHGLAAARSARAAAEERLVTAQEEVIVPLRELRRENHVFEAVSALIRKRADEGRPQ